MQKIPKKKKHDGTQLTIHLYRHVQFPVHPDLILSRHVLFV